jgi:hypothetical protein
VADEVTADRRKVTAEPFRLWCRPPAGLEEAAGDQDASGNGEPPGAGDQVGTVAGDDQLGGPVHDQVAQLEQRQVPGGLGSHDGRGPVPDPLGRGPGPVVAGQRSKTGQRDAGYGIG